MKKFICVLLCALIIAAPATAATTTLGSISLEDLSFQDLLTLDYWLSMELAKRPEWKNVTVPPGVYKIGVDIPAGYWDISRTDESIFNTYIYYGERVDATMTKIDYDCGFKYCALTSDQQKFSILMQDDYYIVIENTSVIFTPHVQPSLGF